MCFEFDPSCLQPLLVQLYSPAVFLWVDIKEAEQDFHPESIRAQHYFYLVILLFLFFFLHIRSPSLPLSHTHTTHPRMHTEVRTMKEANH